MQYSKLYFLCQVNNCIFVRFFGSFRTLPIPGTGSSFPAGLYIFPVCRNAGLLFFLIFFRKFFDIQIRSAYSYTYIRGKMQKYHLTSSFTDR